jgi:uncharacterized protein YyaL (SSP411 family)
MNRLSKENSPYLLQHSDNPVDWYPWGGEAFEEAVKEDKPVFLSIGYSTCHWCHVMEKESFEDEDIARMMNEVFISIKVDREERPDIDGIYMSVCQMLTGSGGWPLTIIMTPDKKPFFAGTYFPKESRFNKPGMKEIITRIKDIWLNRREEINQSSSEIVKALNQVLLPDPVKIDKDIFEKAFIEFGRRFDPEYGGFGNAPKFPSPHNLNFLMRYYKSSRNNEALQMVGKTLDRMRNGGIYDHIGFGFHRYSTDREWLVPHYEKMLYDQALLTISYLELYQLTKKEIYKKTVEEILEYILRDMTSPRGGFYSAEDADSEGAEGKFYLWSKAELHTILGEDADFVSEIFNLEDRGNLPGETSVDNILYLNKPLQEIAEEKNIDENVLMGKVEKAVRKLYSVREKRIHPYKDDKILTDWNGLMISAFAKAAQILNNERYRDTAIKAADFILKELRDKDNRLLHCYRNGKAGVIASLDDYAFLIAAFIDLYETTFDIRWLKTTVELNEDLLKYFPDTEHGGFFFTPDYGEELITRQKEIYDGAIPSGNSVTILNLLKLGRITGDSKLDEAAYKTANFFSSQLSEMPSAFSQALIGLDFGFGQSLEIVIVGKKDDKSTRDFIEYFRKEFLPNKIVLLKEPHDEEMKNIAPFTQQMSQTNNKTTVYVCRHYSCERPVTSIDDVKNLII